VKLDPGSGIDYMGLVGSYVLVNRLDEARATAQEAQARNLDNPRIHLILYKLISSSTMRQEWSVRPLG
jgi:hypothetical protein